MIQRVARPAVVDQQHLVHDRVEFVALQPVEVIDQRTVAAQFLDKDAIAQALRRQKVDLVSRQASLEERGFDSHRPA